MVNKYKLIYNNSPLILKLIKEGKLNKKNILKIFLKRWSLSERKLIKTIKGNNIYYINNDFQFDASTKLIKNCRDVLYEKKDFNEEQQLLLNEIEILFESYYYVKMGDYSMDTKSSLLNRLIYLISNVEIIVELNILDKLIHMSDIEFLLLDHTFWTENKGYEKLKRYKDTKEFIDSYNFTYKVLLTDIILEKLRRYIMAQTGDDSNKKKKLKVLELYNYLIEKIKGNNFTNEIISDLLDEEEIFKYLIKEKLIICYIRYQGDSKYYSKKMTIKPRQTDDVGVLNNIFINNNLLEGITSEDVMAILEMVNNEKAYIKQIKY